MSSRLFITAVAAVVMLPLHAAAAPKATTPIEHVIVVVGENRSFDHLYGVYKPPRGQSIKNLLAAGIVRADGTPGPNYRLAAQKTADMSKGYSPTPPITGSYRTLSQPYASGAFGQQQGTPDSRFPAELPNGPFQITRYVSLGAHTGDPIHRFFHMWQQVNGGDNDLFVWTANNFGVYRGDDVASIDALPIHQGAVAMGFYNMAQGDAPYFKYLAERYAIADNYHQAIMGGTAANYVAMVAADVAVHAENGKNAAPPADQTLQLRLLKNGRQLAENGGVYVHCADQKADGVAAIRSYLNSLPYLPFNDGNCEPGAYYMVNNLDPSYTATLPGITLGSEKWLLPPQTMPHIGDTMTRAGLPWKWYSGGRNDGRKVDREYCGMCDPMTFFESTMTGSDQNKLVDLQQFYVDVRDAKHFPAVAFVSTYDSVSGHPGYAMETGFEQLVKDVVDRVKANPELWKKTAILITFDEGGGYYDSGYVQFIDFFGDGTRVPMIAVSPYARRGAVDHTYYDHASIVKFIERNWNLPVLSQRSRDNLPNPVHDKANPYVPKNRPAIGDLMNLFKFPGK
jgi:acid phosphatase